MAATIGAYLGVVLEIGGKEVALEPKTAINRIKEEALEVELPKGTEVQLGSIAGGLEGFAKSVYPGFKLPAKDDLPLEGLRGVYGVLTTAELTINDIYLKIPAEKDSKGMPISYRLGIYVGWQEPVNLVGSLRLKGFSVRIEQDALLGKWTFVEELHNPKYPPKVNGVWTFSRSGDGFMIIDEFRVFNGSGRTAFLAETYRVYNPVKKIWDFQATLPASGSWDSGTSRVKDKEVFDESTKGTTIARARFYGLSKNSFSCVFETSNDSGRTWLSPINVKLYVSRSE